MNILLVQTGASVSGGVSRYVSNLVFGLQSPDMNFFVTSLEIDSTNPDLAALYGSAEVVFPFKRDNKISYFLGIFRLYKIITECEIDVVHCHCLKSAILAVFLIPLFPKKRFLYTNHGLRFSQKKGSLRRIVFYFLELIICFSFKKSISIREYDYNILSKFKFLRKNLNLIRSFRLDLPIQGDFRDIVSSQDCKYCFCFVGSLLPIKNPKKFLNWVFEVVKVRDISIEAHIFGDGPLANDLKNYATDHQLPVVFHGHVSREKILEFYLNKKYIFICNSSCVETLPLSVVEAYSLGVPLLTSNREGLEDYFQDKISGILLDHEGSFDFLCDMLRGKNDYLDLRQSTSWFCGAAFPSFGEWCDSYHEIYQLP